MWEALSLLGAFLAIEGAIYAGFPHLARRMAERVTQMDEGEMRVAGIVAFGLGVALVWFARS